MATEAPLLHDGSQTVAAANYGNGAGLAGSNTAGTTGGSTGSGQYLAVTLSAARTVATTTGQSNVLYGILQNKPGSGQAADVGIFGITKAVAGGTIAAGAQLGLNNTNSAATNGTLVTFASGTIVGYALEAAVSGQVFTVFVQPR